jgi:hypothetical protein
VCVCAVLAGQYVVIQVVIFWDERVMTCKG